MMSLDATVLLDGIPDATAVLSGDGRIVAVNRAWREYTAENGGAPNETGVGANYLEVCARAFAYGCADARAAEAGLQAVLEGRCDRRDIEYPCPAPSGERWFDLRITKLGGAEGGALVSHVNVTRRKVAERQLAHRAYEDPLTLLPNRELFTERVSAALRQRFGRAPRRDVGLVFVELIRLREINDAYGHAAGDEVLRTAAHRLSALARPQDTIARLSGGEFGLLAQGIDAEGLSALADRVAESLGRPQLVGGAFIEVGVNVGSFLASRTGAATQPPIRDLALRSQLVGKAASAPRKLPAGLS